MPQDDERGAALTRLLVVVPSWLGDTVMCTPALRIIRELLPGAFIGALVRPGIDQLLAGSGLFDEAHVDRALGVMGPKRVASKVRTHRYQAALIFTNSFSSALITRLAGIPRRVGYDRDGRGILLTDRYPAPKRRDLDPYSASTTKPGAWAPVPACDYYFQLASAFLRTYGLEAGEMGPLELGVSQEESLAAAHLLDRAGIPMELHRVTPMALLNPGANNPAKRWPAERFAALADYLARHHNMTILINGSPKEAALVDDVADRCAPDTRIVRLPEHRQTLGTLKGVIKRCRVMVTNDTGPRHIAAALGVPVVSLFGPTDPRWTTIPFEDEVQLVPDHDLPEHEVANDHPDRCDISRIGLGDVVAGVNQLLAGSAR